MNSMDDKRHVRTCALAARDRIPDDDRRRRSAEACLKLEEHFASLLGPKAVLAVYAAMGSEVDLERLVHAAHARGWQVCFPFMAKDDTESELSGKRGESGSASACGCNGVRPCPTCETSSATDDTFPASGHKKEEPPLPATRMEFRLVDRSQFEEAHGIFLARPLHAWSRHELDDAGFAPVSPSQVDGVVVPLVAFDSDGNRLGYGGGNYDRFLGALASARPDAAVVGVAFAEQRIAHIPTEPHDLLLPAIVVA